MRYSSRREAIYRAVCGTDSHPNAEWVYARVREEFPGISLGTVYRNLRSLAEEGKLVTLAAEDGSVHFDGRLCTHAHFVCRACGKISDIPAPAFGAEWEAAGHRIDEIKTVAYGTCADCRREASPRSRRQFLPK